MKGYISSICWLLYVLCFLKFGHGIPPSKFQAAYNVGNISASVPLSTRIRCGNAGLGISYTAVEITSNYSCIAYTANEMNTIPRDADVLYKIGDVVIYTPSYVLPSGYNLIGPTLPHYAKCGSTFAVEVDLPESSTHLEILLHEGVSIADLSDFSLHHPFSAKVDRTNGLITATRYVPVPLTGPDMTYVWSPPPELTVKFVIHVQSTGVEVTSRESLGMFQYPLPIECDRINWFLIGNNNDPVLVHRFSYDSP